MNKIIITSAAIVALNALVVTPAFAEETTGGWFSNFWSGSESAKGDAKGEALGKFKVEFEGGAKTEANGEQRMLGTGDNNTSARSTDK